VQNDSVTKRDMETHWSPRECRRVAIRAIGSLLNMVRQPNVYVPAGRERARERPPSLLQEGDSYSDHQPSQPGQIVEFEVTYFPWRPPDSGVRGAILP
jgi:hypothetical protein